MGRERVAEGMASGSFGEPGFTNGVRHLSGQGLFVKMVSSHFASAWMGTQSSGWKDPLPGPFTTRVGVFASKAFVQMRPAFTGRAVVTVAITLALKLILQRAFELRR